MGIFYNTRIVRDGLTMHLDTANIKSYAYRENLLTYSQQFTDASWIKGGNTVVTDAVITAPDGTLTASTLQMPVGAGTFATHAFSAITATTYTFSLYAKCSSTSTTTSFNIMFENNAGSGSAIASTTVVTTSTAWNRYSVQYTTTATQTYYACIDNIGNTVASNVHIWGAQVQPGPFLNNYVATTNTVVTASTIWNDLSGQGNHATLINAPITTATSGGFILNGTSQYANVANSFVTTATYTKSIWLNCTSFSANNNLLSGNTIFWLAGTNTVRASDTSQGNFSIAAGNIQLSTNIWYNAVVTYNSLATTATWKIYINGVLDTTTFANSNPTLGNIQVGAFGSGNYFQGQLACPMIYNRALSDSEVLQNFQAQRDRFRV